MEIPEELDMSSALLAVLQERTDPKKRFLKPPATMKLAPSYKELHAALDLAKTYAGEVMS